MPWCEDCDRFYTPSTLSAEGNCPSGHHVADPDAAVLVQSDDPGATEPRSRKKVKAPWHFWVLIVALTIYLGWRLVQAITWLIGRYF